MRIHPLGRQHKRYTDNDITSTTPNIIPSTGLVLYLDANNSTSYPGTGTTWFDLSGAGNNFVILSTAFNSSTSVKYMDFNGSFGCAKHQTSDLVPGTNTVTAIVWTEILNNGGTFRTLFRGLSSSANHQVIINTGTNNLGFFDGDSSGGFLGCNFDVTFIPNYTTGWNMLVWRYYPSSPYYVFTINDTPSATKGQITDSRAGWGATRGICSIGAFNNADQNNASVASQFWGNVSSVLLYNRDLSNDEVLTIFNATRSKFGL